MRTLCPASIAAELQRNPGGKTTTEPFSKAYGERPIVVDVPEAYSERYPNLTRRAFEVMISGACLPPNWTSKL